jgi:hypothetical protein
MNFSNWELIINAIIVASALFAIIYTFGVVWRVEKKLDISYKLFLIAIIAFVISELAGFFNFEKGSWLFWLPNISKMIFAVFFLAGIWTMRSLIRKIDGEK